MKLELLMFALTLTGALAFMSHGRRNSGWFGRRSYGGNRGVLISRRDTAAAAAADTDAGAAADAADAADAAGADSSAAEVPTQAELSALVEVLLNGAREGLEVDVMAEDAVAIQQAADAIVDANGGEVEATDVQQAIDDAAASFSGAVAVSSLFDEPLPYEAAKMDAALSLLDSLNTKAQEQEAAGESSKATVAAISMTAQATQVIMAESVGIAAYDAHMTDAKNVNKRWSVNANVNRDRFGRYSYGAGLSHKKGGFEGGVNFNRGFGGGRTFGASLKYTWGR